MADDLIYDLGMNNGDDTDFYLKKGFRVVAVEANPELCAQARQRFASELADGQVHIVNKAVSDFDGEIELFINEQVSGWTTTDRDWKDTRERLGMPSRSITVPAVSMPGLFREYGVPYYLKADIQGNELIGLKSLLAIPDRPKFLSVSSVDLVRRRAFGVARANIEALVALGYDRFKIVDQQKTKLAKCPNPAREGRYIDYTFPHGCSGMFGAELPGEWADATAALREYRKIIWSYKLAGDPRIEHGWFRRLSNDTLRYYLGRIFWRGTTWYDTHAVLRGASTE